MEILPAANQQGLLAYLPTIKTALIEWQFVEIRLSEDPENQLSAQEAAEMVNELFKQRDGRILVCNSHEILMLIHSGEEKSVSRIPRQIEAHLPEGSCEVLVHDATPQGLQKIQMFIRQTKKKEDPPSPNPQTYTFAERRKNRTENIILVADDDLYMRMLVKKGLETLGVTTYETANGTDVVDVYKEHAPNILFLDIHLPGKSGQDILSELLVIDPNAHVIMLSADSSKENVSGTIKSGAKGFLAKPFSKERLHELYKKCPTIQ